MSEAISIICDSCDKELITHSSNPVNYSIELKTINTNINNTGIQNAILIVPPFEGTKHFCGRKCLSDWLSAEEEP